MPEALCNAAVGIHSLQALRRFANFCVVSLLGGSWVVISGVISRVTILITHIRGLITLLRTTHEPPSSVLVELGWLFRCCFGKAGEPGSSV